jgi:hypothetical protein
MSDQNKAERARTAFRLGDELLLFEFFALHNFVGYEKGKSIPDVVFRSYDGAINSLTRLVKLGLRPATAKRFGRCLRGFLEEYKRHFGNEEHQQRARVRIEGVDPEFRTKFMLRGSPIESGEFVTLREAQAELESALPDEARAAFYIGRDAARWHNGMYTHELDTPTAVNDRLRQSGAVLVKHFDDRLPYRPSRFRACWLLYERMRNYFELLGKPKPPAPGYLGLIDEGRTLKRSGYDVSVDLTVREWAVFRRLLRERQAGCLKEVLKDTWPEGSCTDSSVYELISRLREKLEQLTVAVVNNRGVYRLQIAENLQATRI